MRSRDRGSVVSNRRVTKTDDEAVAAVLTLAASMAAAATKLIVFSVLSDRVQRRLVTA